jgi:hypothetical protein
MKKTLLIMACIAASLSLTTVSCSKEETKTATTADPRDQAVGNYNFKTVSNVLVNGVITPVDSSTGSLKVEKDAANSTILIKESNGQLITTGSKIGVGSNGFTFDIEPQKIDTIELEGFNYFIIGTTKYHGAFISGLNTLSFAYKITNSANGLLIVTTCTKK